MDGPHVCSFSMKFLWEIRKNILLSNSSLRHCY